MVENDSVIQVSKLDAACCQLRTAIALWFTDADPVSTHSLALAAYEIVHVVSKKRNRYRRDLLFDSDVIKDEYRSDFNKWLKRYSYFFKHADREPDFIDFAPGVNEYLLLFASLGRELCGIPISREETALLWWFHIHRPEMVTESGSQFLARHINQKTIDSIRQLSKRDFFEAYHDAEYLSRKYGMGSLRQTI
jgi:hypothetical protein